MRVGRDEIRYPEEHREFAQMVADALPTVRAKGAELLGLTAPSLRIVLSTNPPKVGDYYRPTTLAYGCVAALGTGAVVGASIAEAPLTLALPMYLALPVYYAYAFYRYHRRMQRVWTRLGGFAVSYSVLLSPVIALRWPLAPSPEAATVLFPLGQDDVRFTALLAHEYVHIVLRVHYQADRLPAWLDEGLASWFMEQAAGQPLWRPESRAALDGPEPERDPRYDLGTDLAEVWRFYVRAYWQIRALVEAGRLPELLRTPVKQLDSLRPRADARV